MMIVILRVTSYMKLALIWYKRYSFRNQSKHSYSKKHGGRNEPGQRWTNDRQENTDVQDVRSSNRALRVYKIQMNRMSDQVMCFQVWTPPFCSTWETTGPMTSTLRTLIS